MRPDPTRWLAPLAQPSLPRMIEIPAKEAPDGRQRSDRLHEETHPERHLMTQNHDPTTEMYRDLPPKAKLLRLEVANDLLRQFEYWRGDARLNSWQEGFLASMVRRLRESQGKCRISEKQWVKIREIQIAMEAELPDETELYEESFGKG